MTHVITTLADRWPRCPVCGCVGYPWGAEHRPTCPLSAVPDPADWRTE